METRAGDSPREERRREFHQALRELCEGRGSSLCQGLGKPQPSNSYEVRLAPGVTIDLNATEDEISCELKVGSAAGPRAFGALAEHREAVENRLGPLRWESRKGTSWSIGQSLPADTRNRAGWPELNEWRLERGEAFLETFAPLVRQLDGEKLEADA